jgi:mRNA-degrading endonuclease RelE of RelBE toxin-antitoxin system
MRENPFSGDIVRLKGQDDTAWRRRVGEYRILYVLFPGERLIVVTAIRRRTSTTY